MLRRVGDVVSRLLAVVRPFALLLLLALSGLAGSLGTASARASYGYDPTSPVVAVTQSSALIVTTTHLADARTATRVARLNAQSEDTRDVVNG